MLTEVVGSRSQCGAYMSRNRTRATAEIFKAPIVCGPASLQGWRRLGYNRLFACCQKGLAETRCTKSSCTIPFPEKLNRSSH